MISNDSNPVTFSCGGDLKCRNRSDLKLWNSHLSSMADMRLSSQAEGLDPASKSRASRVDSEYSSKKTLSINTRFWHLSILMFPRRKLSM
ncbi:hypothetical protein WICPIJ_007719 [Wickerhamomyces pijperi]|uniref:Uncharacterized protein n=1 Tax=Wickerhamomyces pijperi TaxID=599730 RepID=A0A9P8PZ90_WICPI|nr:hypothetical protein WICPIJ_007719 [Wickerhamomyces pijperi]